MVDTILAQQLRQEDPIAARAVRPRESLEWTRRLVQECGIFAGLSTGTYTADLDEAEANAEKIIYF